MMEKTFIADPNPWTPITNLIDLKHLGKLAEELNECGSAVARCIIQGVDEKEPSTGVANRDWLTKEIADVACNIGLVIEHFDLDIQKIDDRVMLKRQHLTRWHNMGSAFQDKVACNHEHDWIDTTMVASEPYETRRCACGKEQYRRYDGDGLWIDR